MPYRFKDRKVTTVAELLAFMKKDQEALFRELPEQQHKVDPIIKTARGLN